MSASVVESAPEGKASFALRGHNPDVLTCIANLSNDEVFTPPELANEMLDTLADAWAQANGGESIWADSSVRFLDPFTKSGVFLREIVARLATGLADEIPDLQSRVDHILTKQVFGIGITSLTALLARRSVYCSKYANGPHSIAKSFDRDWGNIWLERTEHTWAGDRCVYCGAARAGYERGDDLETHAYAFIHTSDVKSRIARMFGADMKFDVIIGNPPYQLETESERRQARPIYQLFVEQAKRLEPKFLLMITPSRWLQGGMGLAEYSTSMLGDSRLRILVDFIVDKDAFPAVNANGGVSYFLWDRDHEGDCSVTTVAPGGSRSDPIQRQLNEFDVFVRWNDALSIVRKVLGAQEPRFSDRVSSIGPFGLPTTFHGVDQRDSGHPIKFYGSRKVSWVGPNDIKANADWVKRWKVLIPAASDGNEKYPLPIWDSVGPFTARPDEACSWTYLVAALADDEQEADRIVFYARTRLFRFLVALRKVAQHNKAENFAFVPDIPMDREWTDDALFERYQLTDGEREFICSLIRDVEFTGRVG